MEIYDKLKDTPKGRRQVTKRRLKLNDNNERFYDDEAPVDDVFLTQFLTEDVFYAEAMQFHAMKQKERLIVNMLLCLA